ncbi:5-methyltetrahydropteroyltriglutamate--homocysteine methyltransferase [Clostridium butyricum]|uniref:5-methyltetrahydropteroyltriglutamate--homocysteine S-methyltransferase n=1 Tax=Clostridium butyricum TaxID=1492 RepID=A0A512TNE2_CLOBU|nr:5-methyltetrahydropteroyltriglutamate--homocysteine S-methyltransferase [Clostridium butyricum]NAS19978.1 5-methyltetrahydropteroyltriglutamate--homocysteine S-methyltransferase [Clostridium butyricum]NOW22717.1 methionine synthase II (cobalamin-independent) [Clostridium butyricum]GEQ21747.1 5-methyltetrahydropteroyltriglutamate--homocysteine methyltransferase [Clostridium butyricum]
MIQFEDAKKREVTPFRYDIVGSFLRPKALKEERAKFVKGIISSEELKKFEDIEIAKLIEKQKRAGLKVITDGEFRRSWWHLDFMWELNGVEKVEIDNGYKFNNLETRAETARLSGKITGENHSFVEHFKFVQQFAQDGIIARQTIPAPAQFLAELQRAENKEATNKFYNNIDELINDIANAYQTIIQDLYDAGCRSLQLDDCTWGMFCDKKYWEARQDVGVDLKELAELYVKVNNLAISKHPDDMIVTTHVCRGNYHSTFAASGGYEPIAEILFGKENVDGFYLEFDTDRAGDFSPLRFLGAGKQVVLGIVSSKIGELEDKTAIIDRIKEATQYVDINNICISPQCGFASTEEGNILTEDEQWNKIIFVKEIANEIWK